MAKSFWNTTNLNSDDREAHAKELIKKHEQITFIRNGYRFSRKPPVEFRKVELLNLAP